LSNASTTSARIPKPCDECSLCCKVFGVNELGKAADQWCMHFAPGKRCTIYPQRPGECRKFQCGWSTTEGLDLSWRPDNAKFVMDDTRPNELMIVCDPSYPDAWRREPYYSRIKSVAARKSEPFILVQVRIKGRVYVVFPETEIDIGPNKPGMVIQSGYEMKDGKLEPYARFASSKTAPART
jgi:hypothetical protein